MTVTTAVDDYPQDPLRQLNSPFDKMFAAEIREWVSRLPKYQSEPVVLPSPNHPDPRNNLVGLAMSGGGMRSATFNLGVTQALAEYGLMEQVDYMATVSGGGYLGASLTSLCAEDLPYHDPQKDPDKPGCRARLGMSRKSFPYAFPGPLSPGARDGAPASGVMVHGLESPATRHVREHSKMLVPSPGIFDSETWTGASRYIASAVMQWALFLLPPVTAIFLLTMLIPQDIWNQADPFQWRQAMPNTWLAANPWVVTVPLWFLLPVALLALLPGRDQRRGDEFTRTWVRMPQQVLLAGTGATSAAVLFVLGLWTYGYVLEHVNDWVLGLASGGSAAVLVASLRKLLVIPEGAKRILWNLAFAISGYVILGAGLVAWYHFLWNGWDVLGGWRGFSGSREHYWVAWAGVGAAVALTWGLGHRLLNFLSLNRLYEQRIRRTWLIAATPGKGREAEVTAPKREGWTRTWVRPDIKIAGLIPQRDNGWHPTSPYPLICAALNIPGSTGPYLLDRKSEAFVMGPVYSGSALTYWTSTKSLAGFKNMSLAQAASISAAAISPNMGMMTNRTLSIVTTLFNARLGWWVPNPNPRRFHWRRRWIMWPPPLLFWKEMFGLASYHDAFVYLSDGGHFENLGIYELLRRRCKYIIAVDATGERSGKEPLTFGGLGIPLRCARIDFGVLVDIDLRPVMRDPVTGQVKSHFAVGRIHYPRGDGHGSGEPGDPDSGILVFIKAGRVDEPTPPDIINYYYQINPDFPHDTTADQQFDEPQFESYRELGFLAGRAVCKVPVVSPFRSSEVAARFEALDAYYQKLLKDPGFFPKRAPGS